MMYAISYLTSVVILSIVMGAIYYHDEKEELAGFLGFVVGILFWPITIIAIPVIIGIVAFKDWREAQLNDAIKKVSTWGDTYEEAIKTVSEASTPHLKVLLKAARAGKHELGPGHVELIKHELLNRIAEKGLLK